MITFFLAIPFLIAYIIHRRAVRAAASAQQKADTRRHIATIRRMEAALNTYKENPDDHSA